ncbi:DUF2963 domain-containing protein [Candidatus Phytoplasma solani]|uniref:DUF2963 domain-containing protein n=1 Tax=Candidatus Phytoplasma solani TaxID=69896 RepID=UPI003D9C7821
MFIPTVKQFVSNPTDSTKKTQFQSIKQFGNTYEHNKDVAVIKTIWFHSDEKTIKRIVECDTTTWDFLQTNNSDSELLKKTK